MYKSTLVIIALSAIACVVLANKPNEPEEVKRGAASAFSQGLARFSNAVAKGDIEVPRPGLPKATTYSLYSKGLTALGGGKPHLVEQYRAHHYTGVSTTKVPEDHKIISDNLTPEQTAELTKPRPVFQDSKDHLFIP